MSASKIFSNIAVIGAGTMGSGIAAQIANAGLPVLLLDLPCKPDQDDSIELLLEESVDRSGVEYDPVHAVFTDAETGLPNDDLEPLALALEVRPPCVTSSATMQR